MPTYDYQCRTCGHRMEVIHPMTEPGPSACERCGGELRRVLFPAGIIFRGAGFYSTDSRRAPAGERSSAGRKERDTEGGQKKAPEPAAGAGSD